MNKQEFIEAWRNATPEAKEAATTILELTAAGTPTEQAIEAVRDDEIRATLKQYYCTRQQAIC